MEALRIKHKQMPKARHIPRDKRISNSPDNTDPLDSVVYTGSLQSYGDTTTKITTWQLYWARDLSLSPPPQVQPHSGPGFGQPQKWIKSILETRGPQCRAVAWQPSTTVPPASGSAGSANPGTRPRRPGCSTLPAPSPAPAWLSRLSPTVYLLFN